MRHALNARTRKRLHIQGLEAVDDVLLAEVAPWLRLAFALCAVLAGTATATASPAGLMVLVVISAWAAAVRVHPFDHIYNHGIRRLTRTPPLPPRGAPSRFACGFGSVWLLATAWLFAAGHAFWGYVLGGALTAVAALVATTDICLPSLVYRLLFGQPRPARTPVPAGGAGEGSGIERKSHVVTLPGGE
jgi:hypothetical protein